MRTCVGKDLSVFLHMHEEIVQLRRAAGQNDRTCMTMDRLRGALLMSWRDFATFEDLEMALAELLRTLQMARVRHDPAYEPGAELHETCPVCNSSGPA